MSKKLFNINNVLFQNKLSLNKGFTEKGYNMIANPIRNARNTTKNYMPYGYSTVVNALSSGLNTLRYIPKGINYTFKNTRKYTNNYVYIVKNEIKISNHMYSVQIYKNIKDFIIVIPYDIVLIDVLDELNVDYEIEHESIICKVNLFNNLDENHDENHDGVIHTLPMLYVDFIRITNNNYTNNINRPMYQKFKSYVLHPYGHIVDTTFVFDNNSEIVKIFKNNSKEFPYTLIIDSNYLIKSYLKKNYIQYNEKNNKIIINASFTKKKKDKPYIYTSYTNHKKLYIKFENQGVSL